MNKIQSLRFAFALLLLLPLSSCFVAKKYEQPDLQTQNLFRTDKLTDSASIVMDSVSMAEVSWKNLFTDTLLKSYIQTALDNNLDIRIAVQNIDAAGAYVKQGKAAFWPSVSAALDYNHAYYSQNGPQGGLGSRNFDQFQLGALLSWEADIWGKIRSQKRAFSATYLQTIEAHKAVKTRLVAQVATTYYQIMALKEQIAITEKSIAARDSSLSTTMALKAAGQVTEVAVKQTESQLYDARILYIDLKKQLRILENSFCILLNEPPHAITTSPLNQQEIETELTVGVPADLLANRPDVRAAEFNLINAFELTNVAKSNFYPSLTITASGGLQSIDIKNWLNVESVFANFAGELLQPIFNRRQIKTAYEVAKSQQQQALLAYEKALLIAGNDVSNALYEYQSQTETIQLEEKQFEALKKAVDYSEQLLINGLANYLEVLTARQSALAAEINLVNARYARLNAIVSLYEALGGGWK